MPFIYAVSFIICYEQIPFHIYMNYYASLLNTIQIQHL